MLDTQCSIFSASRKQSINIATCTNTNTFFLFFLCCNIHMYAQIIMHLIFDCMLKLMRIYVYKNDDGPNKNINICIMLTDFILFGFAHPLWQTENKVVLNRKSGSFLLFWLPYLENMQFNIGLSYFSYSRIYLTFV